ncbi:MAG: TIGR02450 family Trp-rich protein [Candidatus Sericytochromatia bacterium]
MNRNRFAYVSRPAGNRFCKAKLLGSKWTAVHPQRDEKHFIVLDWVQYRPGEKPERLEIEAVCTHRIYEIDYRELKDDWRWSMGWH